MGIAARLEVHIVCPFNGPGILIVPLAVLLSVEFM